MKYKQYQKMKDSGIEWIGEIPEHWEVKPLFVVCKNNKEKKLALNYTNKMLKISFEKNKKLLNNEIFFFEISKIINFFLKL